MRRFEKIINELTEPLLAPARADSGHTAPVSSTNTRRLGWNSRCDDRDVCRSRAKSARSCSLACGSSKVNPCRPKHCKTVLEAIVSKRAHLCRWSHRNPLADRLH